FINKQIKHEEKPLTQSTNIQRLTSEREYCFFDIDGNVHKCRPHFHHEDYFTRFNTYVDKAEKNYAADGLPPHASNTKPSVFRKYNYTQFHELGPLEMHNAFQESHIVLTNCPGELCAFDEKGLSQVLTLDKVTSIQDYSCTTDSDTESDSSDSEQDGSHEPKRSTPKTCQGRFQEVLENAVLGVKGKILNALDLPLLKDYIQIPSLSTDHYSWIQAKGEHLWPLPTPYPTGDMRWALVGTADTLTFCHVDCNGLSTGVQVLCGAKVWFILHKKNSLSAEHIESYIGDHFQLDYMPESSDYDVEAVYLRPGDMLLMRPNTPHLVYGPEHTICKGFHFHTTGTMPETATGTMHTFVLHEYITNTQHTVSHIIILRMLTVYYIALFEDRKVDDEFHIPDISTWKGLLSLLSVCNLAVMGNVLDFRTYLGQNQTPEEVIGDIQQQLMERFDCNNIPYTERIWFSYGRGMALVMLEAINECCVLQESGRNDIVASLPMRHLARQMVALKAYKLKAESANLPGAAHCSSPLPPNTSTTDNTPHIVEEKGKGVANAFKNAKVPVEIQNRPL
ncbi:hypothetical protein CVT24_013199, partial [Panaeolus cyanescens]